MKKLFIVTLLVACATGMVNAAQLQWKFSATKADSTAYAGYTVYMLFATDVPTSITKASDITSAAKSTSAFVVSSKSAGTVATTYQSSSLATGTYSIYMYLIAADNKSYYASSAVSATAVEDGTTPGVPAATPTAAAFAAGSTLANASSWTAFAAPEPASIGLLMLGLCALGLKRKIA